MADGQTCACPEARTCENIIFCGKGILRWKMILDCLDRANAITGTLASRERLAGGREIWQEREIRETQVAPGANTWVLVLRRGGHGQQGLWKPRTAQPTARENGTSVRQPQGTGFCPGPERVCSRFDPHSSQLFIRAHPADAASLASVTRNRGLGSAHLDATQI